MGEAGDVFVMPDGARYILKTPTAQTGGEYVEFEWEFPPGAFAPPIHVHPSQVEEYEVLEGEFEVLVGDEWRTLRAGESASVPVGVAHTFGRPKHFVRVRNFHRPALGFEAFIERVHHVLKAKDVRSIKDPRVPVYIATVWKQHPDTLQATRSRDRIGMAVAASLGRAALRIRPAGPA
jgi:quercetin dioxygenase-like cupin family protein